MAFSERTTPCTCCTLLTIDLRIVACCHMRVIGHLGGGRDAIGGRLHDFTAPARPESAPRDLPAATPPSEQTVSRAACALSMAAEDR